MNQDYCLIAIKYEGKLISYDYYLTLEGRRYDPTRQVCIIETANYLGNLPFDEQNEIIQELSPCFYRKRHCPDGIDYQWSSLEVFMEEYGYEARIEDIMMGRC